MKKNISTLLNKITGRWNTLNLVDIDGDLDIVAGNHRKNPRINADINEPCTIYAKDFYKDGNKDIIIGGNCLNAEIGTGNYDAMASLF